MTTSGSEHIDIIQIRANSKRNGLTITLIGLVALLVSILIMAVIPEAYRLAGIFLLSASFVTILIGWFKMREPEHSIALSREEIVYRHRHGQWQLSWQNLQRVDTPTVDKGLEKLELQLVGFRMKDYRPLLDSISPRLASNLLIEQRPLWLQSTCPTGTCYSENMFEDDRYRCEDGTEYSGIKAMLANRMCRLREILGYDLFINASELDRDMQSFVSLVRECQQQVLLNSPES